MVARGFSITKQHSTSAAILCTDAAPVVHSSQTAALLAQYMVAVAYVVVNGLVVEYNPNILLPWEGHANLKFAGSVELFEYLYKYLFKGNDKAQYDVTMDSKVEYEIKDWLKGRYICATEAAWIIFGYVAYDRSPSVVPPRTSRRRRLDRIP